MIKKEIGMAVNYEWFKVDSSILDKILLEVLGFLNYDNVPSILAVYD